MAAFPMPVTVPRISRWCRGIQWPRPPHWSGFRVLPRVIEFWRDRPFRLHERMVYHAEGEPGAVTGWTVERLFP